MCCMYRALDVLHVICTQVCHGQFSIHVEDSLWPGEEIVRNLELCLSV